MVTCKREQSVEVSGVNMSKMSLKGVEEPSVFLERWARRAAAGNYVEEETGQITKGLVDVRHGLIR